jgi:transmembrane protein EpsG
MIHLIQYSLIVMIVINIAFLSHYFSRRLKILDKPLLNQTVLFGNKSPVFNILFITIILSVYSAYLATSGDLTDPIRYAWSFLYRYPAYYGSLETIISSKTEVGFLLLNMAIDYLTDDPYWLFLSIALIITFINLYTATKISNRYGLIIFLYLISIYFFQSTYLLRQALAVSFANLALLAYLKDLKIRYFLLSIVASTFHATAIILFPIFFIFKKTKNAKSYLNIIVVTVVVFFLFGSVFNTILSTTPYIGQYINSENFNLSQGGGTLTVIFKGLPFYFLTIIALVKRKSLKQIMFKADFYIICSVFYSISWLLSYNMYWFFRMGWYFLLPTLALVPIVFSTIKNPKERFLYYIIFIFSLMLLTYRQIFITLN